MFILLLRKCAWAALHETRDRAKTMRGSRIGQGLVVSRATVAKIQQLSGLHTQQYLWHRADKWFLQRVCRARKNSTRVRWRKLVAYAK